MTKPVSIKLAIIISIIIFPILLVHLPSILFQFSNFFLPDDFGNTRSIFSFLGIEGAGLSLFFWPFLIPLLVLCVIAAVELWRQKLFGLYSFTFLSVAVSVALLAAIFIWFNHLSFIPNELPYGSDFRSRGITPDMLRAATNKAIFTSVILFVINLIILLPIIITLWYRRGEYFFKKAMPNIAQ